jgi:hypothetical protein
MNGDVEKGDPILHGLQGKAEWDQEYAEDAHVPFGNAAGAPLDDRTESAADQVTNPMVRPNRNPNPKALAGWTNAAHRQAKTP